MNKNRRQFLHRSAAALAASLAPAALSANWPKEAFETTALQQALDIITGGDVEQGAVTLKAPGIAEDGGAVRVEVETALDNVESITLLVEKNPVPLTSQFMLHGQSHAWIATNLKVRETSDVIALVKAGGRYYSDRRTVRVTAGGCS